MVTHTGDLPFKCQKCEKGFIFSCDLRKHEWSHNVEKPYQCKQCGKAFKGPESIKKHGRIHRAEKPYEGKQCGKAFHYLSSLDTKDVTQERQHMYVKHVLKYSFGPALIEGMKKSTVEKNTMSV